MIKKLKILRWIYNFVSDYKKEKIRHNFFNVNKIKRKKTN
jgi:hypothetical protein